MKLKGLYTAIVTPFDPAGRLDEEGLRNNLRYQLKHQVDGVVALGTTGEDPTLTLEEKQTVVEITVEEVKGKASIIIGTGSNSTSQSILNMKRAKEMGADAALVVTPYYNKPTQEGLYQHFAALSNAVDLPLCIYNVEGRTGQNLQTKTLERLMAFPSIIGVKEASGDIVQIGDVIATARCIRPDFAVLSGDDGLTLPLMALGGQGVISVASNLIPDPLNKLINAALSEDWETTRFWHYQLLPFFKAFFIETNPIPIKTAMKMCGMPSGPCRLPLCDLRESNWQKLEQIIRSIPSTWI